MVTKRKCPNCQSTNHAKILWGLPANMKKLEGELERKEIVLGGCCVSWDDPKWKCNDCGTRWN